jgi:putative thioredoxin
MITHILKRYERSLRIKCIMKDEGRIVEEVAVKSIIDVGESTFQEDVIERSATVPVIVDFWAPWCNPCRMLGPILEKLAVEAKGSFVLAKLNVDNNPNLAARYGVQSIPAVKAFQNGKVVDEFTGSLPETNIRQFLRRFIPSPADGQVKQADELAQQGQTDEAIALYRQVLTGEMYHAGALLGLGRAILARRDYAEAIRTLQQVPYGGSERGVADTLLARARLQQIANGRDEADYRSELQSNPGNLALRLQLAGALAAREEYQPALTELLEAIRNDKGEARKGARAAMLDIFRLLGDNHPLTLEYRAQLAMALF